MASSFTTNLNLEKPANGDDVDTWDVPVNGNSDIIDKFKGGTVNKSLTNANVTMTVSELQNMRIALTGVLSGNVKILIPTGVGGTWVVSNACTGAFTVSVQQVSLGALVVVPQAVNSLVTSDGTNCLFADDRAITGSQFASGTKILFYQTLAPLGWTKDTSVDNRGLRFTSGTAGLSPGGFTFDQLFSATSSGTVTGTVGGHVLILSETPGHVHAPAGGGTFCTFGAGGSLGLAIGSGAPVSTIDTTTAAAGGGGSHDHPWTFGAMNLNLAYASVVVATKD